MTIEDVAGGDFHHEPPNQYVVESSEGIEISVADLGGDGPDLLIGHATGFCGAVLSPLASRIGQRFRRVLFDQRGHGRSSRPADGEYPWNRFSDDLIAVVNALELESPIVFGHSSGGAAALLAEEAQPGAFRAIYCYEPVMWPSDDPLPPGEANTPLSKAALARKSSFESRRIAYDNFASKPPLNVFHPKALTAYIENGFGPTGSIADEGEPVSLLCSREDESKIYSYGFSHTAFAHLSEIRCPVIYCAGAETEYFTTEYLSELAARTAESTVHTLPSLGHFGPMQDPDAVAASFLEAVNRFV